MVSPARIKFKSTQEWHNFVANKKKFTGNELLQLRQFVYQDIEKLRKRPLLVYATRFLDRLPLGTPNYIDLNDVDGFTDLINSVDDGDSVDVLLHSPGGRPDATERLVTLLRNKFDQVHFLIPHSAYSAATMLALSGDSITLHPSAVLGPIDPQINGIPARSIKRGFEKVKEQIKKEGPESLPAYIPLIEKYSIDLLEQCEDAEKLAKELITEWLTEYMFRLKKPDKAIKSAVNYFSNYDLHLMHSRPLTFNKIHSFNLKIALASGNLEELLWECHILLNGFFGITSFVKLYETSKGISWGKQLTLIKGKPASQKRQ